MGKRGPKAKGSVHIGWTKEFAYAIGLLTADGCLSKDGRHIDFTSKDRQLILIFKRCLGLRTKVSVKKSGSGNWSFHTQFGDVLFYRFLRDIGLTPAKSKTVSALNIPRKYFSDFLRGYFDGDGTSFSYYDPIFTNSYRFYISFISASPKFINWLQKRTRSELGINGHLSRSSGSNYVQLRFSKREALVLAKHMYRNAPAGTCLRRKYLKIQRSVGIIERRRGGEIGRHATFRT